MLSVTEAACGLLADNLSRSQVPDDTALRVVREGGNLTIRPDQASDDDVTFDHDGKPLLVMDEEMAQELDNRILDVEETPDGPRLALSQSPMP
jgi:hypothetical protein